jgi:uncharacterized protein YlxW (UPF0749 family)
MYRRSSQLAISLIALILGFLVVVQLRAGQASAGLGGVSAQNLTVLVANLNTRNDELRSEIANLEAQLSDITSAQAQGSTVVDQIGMDLHRIQAWAGLLPVSGPGVTISVAGPIPGPAVEDLINELHNAGAEAIAVEGIRLVPGSVVSGPPGQLAVDDQPLDDPFEITVVGSKEALTGSLTRTGGIIAQLGATNPAVTVTVTPLDNLLLPATKRDLIPRNGRPRL